MQGTGTTLEYTSSGSGYINLTGIVSVSIPKVTVAKVDITTLADTAMDYDPGYVYDNGSLEFEIQHAAVTTTLLLPSTPVPQGLYYWRLTYADGLGFTFRGIIEKAVAPQGAINTESVWKVTVLISGSITSTISD